MTQKSDPGLLKPRIAASTSSVSANHARIEPPPLLDDAGSGVGVGVGVVTALTVSVALLLVTLPIELVTTTV